MSTTDYSRAFQVGASPALVFNAITVEIDKWWTIYSNIADKLNAKLTVRFGETTFKEMLVTELDENKKVTWKVIKAFIDIGELSKKDEWVDTEIVWEITPIQQGSKIHFVHKGLIPEFECYSACEGGWNYFLDSLKNYLETGQGTPHGIN